MVVEINNTSCNISLKMCKTIIADSYTNDLDS